MLCGLRYGPDGKLPMTGSMEDWWRKCGAHESGIGDPNRVIARELLHDYIFSVGNGRLKVPCLILSQRAELGSDVVGLKF